MARGRLVVVGASLAGLRAAEALRQQEYDGEVVVVGAEPHRPYDRPPLSKKVLAGEWEPDRIQLRKDEVFDDLEVTWRLGTRATALDVGEGRLDLDEGDPIEFDGCIIATGAAPRRLDDHDRFDHVHEVRTLDDSLRLRERLLPGGRRVAVIGAGFIGLEVAATATQLGNEVTVLEGAEAPLIRGLGAEMGAAIGRFHTDRDVEVRCGVRVDRLDASGVLLEGGELVPADEIVVGIGVQPITDWLADSGLECRDGVVCDEHLRARTVDGGLATGVYAAGDVLRWPNQLFDEEMRIEHWTNAAEQGAHAARNLLAELGDGDPEPYAPVPFFWSDQFDLRIQFLGRAGADDELTVAAGSVDEEKLLALYSRDGRLRGALGINAPRWVMQMRTLLADGADLSAALAKVAEIT